MRNTRGPLPTFTGEDIERRRSAVEDRLRELRDIISDLHLAIVVTAKNRSESEDDETRAELLEIMRKENGVRRKMQTEWDRLKGMYEDLMFLNATALLYSN
ncbi:hypothetical protein VKT23_020622 [Stygiomarasmius scandens]|uniref:Uncharacterized protein n=1 Tax=Marasmiellus scandens TaxID=2682957 RepID=A0ABR1IIP6_9AGAR